VSNEMVLNSELLEPLREEFTDKLELHRRLFADCEFLAKRIMNSDSLDDAKNLAQEILGPATFESQTVYPSDKVVELLSTERANIISSLKMAHQEFKVIRNTAEELEVVSSSPNAHRKARIIGAAREMALQLSSNSALK
jgi:hypothetical protein